MIRFPSAGQLKKSLSRIEVKEGINTVPLGHALSHVRFRMLDSDVCEVTTTLSGQWVTRLLLTEAEGTPGLDWLVSPLLFSCLPNMPQRESLTFEAHPNGINLRSGLIEVQGRAVQRGNRLVGLYPDNVRHFQVEDVAEELLAVAEEEPLTQALLELSKFGAFAPDERRLLLVNIQPESMRFITSSKESNYCLLQHSLPVEGSEDKTFCFEGRVLPYLRGIVYGPTQVRVREEDGETWISFVSGQGSLTVRCREAEVLQEQQAHLFDTTGPFAPLSDAQRHVLLTPLQEAVTMQTPNKKDPQSYLRNLVLHPYRGGLFFYRPGNPSEKSSVACTHPDPQKLLDDLALEFPAKKVNSSALKVSLDTLRSYKGRCEGQGIDASLLRLRLTHTMAGTRKVYQLFLETGLSPQPDMSICIICDNPDDLIDGDEFD